jgi:hypothetical protein
MTSRTQKNWLLSTVPSRKLPGVSVPMLSFTKLFPISSCASLSTTVKNFEVRVFSGECVTPIIDPNYFKRLEGIRGESSRLKRKAAAIKAVASGIANKENVADVLNGVTLVKQTVSSLLLKLKMTLPI